MLAGVIAFFLKRPALIGLGLMALVIGVQTARLGNAKHGEEAAHKSLLVCRGSLDAENASVAHAAALSAAAIAQAAKGLAAAAPIAAHIEKQRAPLHDYSPKGASELSRWQDADRAVQEALK
jgi:hypothetical protein